MAPLMRDRTSRRRLVEEVQQFRAERDADRYAELDSAIERLVERFGGVPSSKVEGLRHFAAGAGLDAATVEARLAAVPVVQTRTAPAAPDLPPAVLRQVRADLDELGRLLGTSPPVTLFDLLGLSPGASPEALSQAREAAAARNRALRPDRRRALVDDLLSAVTRLLVQGDPQVYLDAVAQEVTDRLRPRVAAAVLVEDVLTAEDFAHLVGEAEAAGLDRARAERVVAGLAREVGVAVPDQAPGRPPVQRAPRHPPGGAASGDAAAVRAALRAGRVLEARQLVDVARGRARVKEPELQAVADEVAGVLAEAALQWRAVKQSLAARRFHQAAVALEALVRIAVDVPAPDGTTVQEALRQARAGLEAAGARLEQAEALTGAAREDALLAALREFPDAELLVQAVQSIPVHPPREVHTERTPGGGGVRVRWQPSLSTGDVEYRVLRVGTDGSRRPLGTTRASELEDGEPQGAEPAYVVVARRAGVLSEEVVSRTAAAGPPASRPATAAAPPPPNPGRGAPPPVTALVATPLGRRLRLTFAPPSTGTAQVRRLPPGSRPPAVGSVVRDLDALGTVVTGMAPGLAVDRRPVDPTGYVVVTVDAGTAVAGAGVHVVDLPPVNGLHHAADLLRWNWPAGCTEAMVVWSPHSAPSGALDPQAERRKVTNTRYEIEGGVALPAQRPLHVAVFTCTRVASELVASLEAPPDARLAFEAPAGPPSG
jgi:hypothetical protein